MVAPPGTTTRPATARLREAVFNALGSRGLVVGADVVDLFAGSGAMGIEALSRGAEHVLFVDPDRAARRAIEQNLDACGLHDRAKVVASTAERVVREAAAAGREFDLALCDPPFVFDGWPELLKLLPAAFAVLEAPEPVGLPDGWDLVREARYGASWLGFAERGSREQDGVRH